MDVRRGGRAGPGPKGEGCSTDSSVKVLLLGVLLLFCSFTEKVGERRGGRAKDAFPLTFNGEGSVGRNNSGSGRGCLCGDGWGVLWCVRGASPRLGGGVEVGDEGTVLEVSIKGGKTLL